MTQAVLGLRAAVEHHASYLIGVEQQQEEEQQQAA
jgi:hypothetical protein